jgi:hypothetical protein
VTGFVAHLDATGTVAVTVADAASGSERSSPSTSMTSTGTEG